MSTKEVTNLRKEGKLKEAYDLAQKELNADPSEWTRMSLFWVLRDYVQNIFIPSNNIEQARIYLKQMSDLLPNMMDSNGAGEKAYLNLFKLIIPNSNLVKQAYDISKTDPNKAYTEIINLFGTDGSSLDDCLHEDYGWIIYRYIKTNLSTLSSVKIRSLLRDYMRLHNKRPSMLHSMILNFALNFSKEHTDFNLYNFFLLWGPNNLQYSDYHKGHVDGNDIPSLISRICKIIVNCNVQFFIPDFIDQLDNKELVIEHLRESYFWKIMNLNEENKQAEVISSFDEYVNNYAYLGASHWHSEILKIANRFIVNVDPSIFVNFVKKWDGDGNLREEDWKKNKIGEKEFPSLAVKTATRCFEDIKTIPNKISNEVLIWLKNLFSKVKVFNPEDYWSIRTYAIICNWCGDIEEAIEVYKSLLLNMGEKYFLWSELSNCINNNLDLKIGLLLKAKSLEKNEDFLDEIHLALASLWLSKGYNSIANQELKTYAKHRQQKGWSISNRFHELKEISNSCKNNTDSVNFSEYIQKAENYVYDKFDWTDFVLTDKWLIDNIEKCSFYDGKDLNFTIKTKRFPILKEAKIGDIIQFKCHSLQKNNHNHKKVLRERTRKRTIVKQVIPLAAQNTNMEPWSILPIKYGVIDYINEEKKVLHIITQDSKQAFYHYKESQLKSNSFVKFMEYIKQSKEETHICIVNIEACSIEEAMPNMQSLIAIVDNINEAKQLFHMVSDKGFSTIVRFDQTELRPSIGDSLHITYYSKKNKDGKTLIKFLDIKKSEIECKKFKKTITGHLKMKYKNVFYDDENDVLVPDFAFIEDFYVHRNLLKKHNITQDCDVIAKAVMCGDNKWKVYDLEVV